MHCTHRTRTTATKAVWLAAIAAIALASVGCTMPDENPDWNPRADMPPWTYDAPLYYRPTRELPVVETIGGVPVFYSDSLEFFVSHPGGAQPPGTPRIAVWRSSDRGRRWMREGYFGVEQTHFLAHVEGDGRYWVRLVGPGQGATAVPPGRPDRIYVVDTDPPVATVSVSPPPVTDDDPPAPRRYEVGEVVEVSYIACDANLKPRTVSLALAYARFPDSRVFTRLVDELAPAGRLELEIPPAAGEPGGMRVVLTARDKAGNVAAAATPVIRVEGTPPVDMTPRPVSPEDPVAQFEGTPGARPGWPEAGAMIRGGRERIVDWMPATAGRYADLRLEFSSDHGETWQVVADPVADDRAVRWTVPEVRSHNCRLRLTGADDAGERKMLVMTRRFGVDTLRPDVISGPEPVFESISEQQQE